MRQLTLFLLFVIAASSGLAQEFEVANLRRFEPMSHSGMDEGPEMAIRREPTILRARGVTLDHLVRWAYQIKTYELVGHDWKQWREVSGMQPLYNVEAQFQKSASESEVRLMLRKLLQQRVELACHVEKHEVDGYVATLGTKGLSKAIHKTPEGPDPAEGIPTSKPMLRLGPGADSREVTVSVVGATMAEVLDEVSGMLRAPLVDGTGLVGKFDAVWKMDFGDAKSFDAFQETVVQSLRNLGLNTSRSKVLVNGLMIDHVGPLTEN